MPAPGYQRDLAHIHDVGFGGFARAAAPFVLAQLRAHRIRRGLVVDLGCGSGILAAALVARGYDVLGIDLSPAMIRIARARAPRARFEVGSLLRVPLPGCQAVTALGECVNYLFDPQSALDRLERLFARIHAALAPGGVFVFDAALPGQVERGTTRLLHREGDGWAILVRVDEDRRRALLTRQMTIFRRAGKLYRRSEETHRLRLYRAADLRSALEQAGFRVQVLRRIGRSRLARSHAAFIAVKPR